MKHEGLIYSRWLWTLSLLYYYGINPYSPLLPMIGAITFCLYIVLRKFPDKFHWTKKVGVLLVELFFAYLAFIKDPSRSLFNMDDLSFNSIILLFYLLVVKLNGTSIEEIYFKIIPKSHRVEETLMEHFKRILSTK